MRIDKGITLAHHKKHLMLAWNKVEGDTCEVITPKNETLTGTCKVTPRQTQSLCIPDKHKHPDKK